MKSKKYLTVEDLYVLIMYVYMDCRVLKKREQKSAHVQRRVIENELLHQL